MRYLWDIYEISYRYHPVLLPAPYTGFFYIAPGRLTIDYQYNKYK